MLMDQLVDPDRLVMSGFSAGGRVALHMLLKDAVKAKGIILVGPWLPDLISLEPLIPKLREAKVRAYLVCGDRDRDCFDSTNRLAELLGENGVSFRYRVVVGMGHCYPTDFEDDLARATSYILEG
jgi:predicted esterase